MSSYFTSVVENNWTNGTVKIQCTKKSSATSMPSGTAVVRIKKKLHSAQTYTTIYNRTISALADYTFTVYDYGVICGEKYDYIVQDVIGGTEQIGDSHDEITCDFNGIDFCDMNTGVNYTCRINPIMDSIKRNVPVSYINPIGSKYPHAVINSDNDYYSGTFSGVFHQFNSDTCTFVLDDEIGYKDSVLAYFINGNNKMMRSSDGRHFVVSVSDVKEVKNEVKSLQTVNFTWTEIADFPAALIQSA